MSYCFLYFLVEKENVLLGHIFEYVKRIDGWLDKLDKQLSDQRFGAFQWNILNNDWMMSLYHYFQWKNLIIS